ncbi:MAG: hypothetical protein IKW64_00700 [Clostridia bacterium]|nr:hypothetical protein [Clostridia bacterium]
MKKILALILTLTLVLTFAACGKKPNNEVENESETQIEELTPDTETETLKEDEKAEDKPEVAPESKPESKPQAKPEAKPSETAKPQASATKPAEKPAQKPEEKPDTTKPETTPEVKPEASTPATLGNTLLADFKSKASGSDVVAIAESLLQNPAIKFGGGAMSVEPGLLSGFDNTEITGFKSGAVFMPMIGSIPFVGYVFELENAADAPAFISKLKSSANLRWNVCVEADEMVAGSVGTKVFFVMCPTSLED